QLIETVQSVTEYEGI
ncbi:uroporphyrinogen-III C-methyltransferase, partial [Vibrio parahaemolyticus EKP-028]